MICCPLVSFFPFIVLYPVYHSTASITQHRCGVIAAHCLGTLQVALQQRFHKIHQFLALRRHQSVGEALWFRGRHSQRPARTREALVPITRCTAQPPLLNDDWIAEWQYYPHKLSSDIWVIQVTRFRGKVGQSGRSYTRKGCVIESIKKSERCQLSNELNNLNVANEIFFFLNSRNEFATFLQVWRCSQAAHHRARVFHRRKKSCNQSSS